MDMAIGLSMMSVFMRVMNQTADNMLAVRTNKDMYERLLEQKYKYIYAILDGYVAGPYSLDEIVGLIKAGRITRESYIWKGGMADWQKADTVADISPLEFFPPAFSHKDE